MDALPPVMTTEALSVYLKHRGFDEDTCQEVVIDFLLYQGPIRFLKAWACVRARGRQRTRARQDKNGRVRRAYLSLQVDKLTPERYLLARERLRVMAHLEWQRRGEAGVWGYGPDLMALLQDG